MSTNLVPCACGQSEFIKADGSTYHTNCTQDTKRTFAPGHDARLKGFLIRAAVLGQKVRIGTKTLHPMEVANSHGFGYQVQAGIDNATSRAANKKTKPAAASKPRALASVKALPSKPKTFLEQAATAKVGRWVKHGMYDHDARTFTYTDAKGNVLTLHPDKFTNLELG